MSTETERDLRQEWETPTAANTAHWERPMPFFDVLDAEFDFQIDVCATNINAKCDDYIAPLGDVRALMIDALYPGTPWFPSHIMRAWCNPGFSNMAPWLEKAYEEVQSCPGSAVVVVMARVAPSTGWWMNWATKASEIRLIGGRRIQFVPPKGVKRSSNMQENCLIIFRPKPHNRETHIWTWDWTEG